MATLPERDNRPRKLNPYEIEHIVSVIDYARTIFPKVAKSVIQGYQERLRYQLREINLVPAGIDMMRNEIARQYRDSQISPGSAVGIHAGGAFGETMTQSTLNTFHKTGMASNTTTGIRGFQELINARIEKSNPSSTVHFVDKTLDLRQILQLKTDIVHLTVRDLMKDYSHDNVRSLIGNNKLPYWYTLYLHIQDQKNGNNKVSNTIKHSDWFLRLNLHIDKMYSAGITMEELCQAIENKQLEKDQSAPSVICIPSPFNLGIIDIYPLGSSISAPQSSDISERNLFFLTIILENIDKITLRGIEGISGLEPTYFPIILSISQEKYIDDLYIEGDSTTGPTIKVQKRWKLLLNNIELAPMSLDHQRVIKLLDVCNIVTERVDPVEGAMTPIWVKMPVSDEHRPSFRLRELAKNFKTQRDTDIMNGFIEDITTEDHINGVWKLTVRRLNDRIISLLDDIKLEVMEENSTSGVTFKIVFPPEDSPLMRMRKLINDDRMEAENARKNGHPQPPSEISNASKYYYAFTKGDNLSALLQLEIIDENHTYSNNIHYNLKEFGIEASRKFLIKEFIDVISADGASVNIQHILMLVDFMTRTGSITKISMNVTDKAAGTLGSMTVDSALKKLWVAAAFGVQDVISGTSSSIMVGKPVNVGTVVGDDEVFGKHVQYEKAVAELERQHKYGDFSFPADQFEEAVTDSINMDMGLDPTQDDFAKTSLHYEFNPAPSPATQIDSIDQPERNSSTDYPPTINIPSHLLERFSDPASTIIQIPDEPNLINIRPNIPSRVETISLSVDGQEDVPEQTRTIHYTLPSPTPSTRLDMPGTLRQTIEAASRLPY